MVNLPVAVLAHPAASGDNPLLKAQPGLMIWTLVIFGITLYILKKKVFGPIGQIITKRRDNIAESIDEAERSRDEATRLLEDYKARLTEAQAEAEKLREQGRKEGERQKAEIITQAQAQRERTVTDAEAQIEAQARAAAAGVRDDVVSLALMAAEKVSRKSLDDADHRKLIEEAIAAADLSALSNGATA